MTFIGHPDKFFIIWPPIKKISGTYFLGLIRPPIKKIIIKQKSSIYSEIYFRSHLLMKIIGHPDKL
jgi:hypothetical protein